MAITFNSGVTYEVVQTASSYSDSVTAPALTDGLMTLVAYSGNGSQTNRPNSATFNGDAFTRQATYIVPLNGYSGGAIFTLVNPDAVTANVVVTLLASISGRKTFGAMFWEGVDQTTPVNATNGETTTTGTSKTISVTTTVDNSWLVGGFYSDTNSFTAGSNTTFPTLTNGGGSQFNSIRYAHSTSARTPTGSYSLNATLASSGDSGELCIAISPSGGGGGSTIKSYLGTVTASVKTVLNGTAIASRKTWNGIT